MNEQLGGSGSRCARADSDKNVAQLASKSKLLINIPKLKEAWEANHVLTKDDWHEWMRRFSVALLKESPNYALHQCLSLAQVSIYFDFVVCLTFVFVAFCSLFP